jgi:virginiamycin B lyase
MGMRRADTIAFVTMAAALLLAAATLAQEPAGAPASAATEIDRSSGAHLYARYCAGCHGESARGTLIGFPLVDRPAGPVTPELLLEALRTPLQFMPSFPRNVISDDAAGLIAQHVAALEHAATGAPLPPAPELSSALQPRPSLSPAPVARIADPLTYDIKEFDAGGCGPGHDLAVGPDGRVWYAGFERNNIVMFDPRRELFRCWPAPVRNSRPQGLRVDRDGMVWFTLTSLPDNKVAMFDPRTELFSEFLMPHRPQPFPYPYTLTFDADRNPVFSLAYGDGIGRIERRTGHFDYLPLPTFRAHPYGVEVARNGHIWVAESIPNKLADIDPKTGKAVEFVHPRAAEDPGLRRLAFDTHGNVWFSEHEFGSLGAFDPRSKRWRSWRAPANGGRAYGIDAISIDRRDAVWFTHSGGNYVGRFDPRSEAFTVYPLPSADTNCRTLDFARDGTLWCVSSNASKLVRLTLRPAG